MLCILAPPLMEVLHYSASKLIGGSLSEPHTSVTTLLDACVCAFVRGYIPKILIERTDFKFVHVLKQIHVQ